ncbi:MAG: penicillin-binding transpeptidase domain-containing protein, partial [Pseudomonadota bacterium]
MQAGATLRKLIQKRGKELNAKQGAIVVMDVNGGVRALVGGYDYAKSQFNRAVKAKRQPGSTFKPFVYLTALESGLRPTTTTYDLPISIEGWSPKNANGKYTGAITLRNALARSVNTVAVRLALDAGPERVARTATRLGIKSKLEPEPSLALGTSEVSLIGLTQAYNTFAAGGQETTVHVIRRIRSSGGRVLYAHAELPGQRIVAEPHVGAINDMLNAALVNGTGRRAGIPKHPAAGKTGTSQKFRDAWFIGYTAHMTAGVWIGNDRGRPMKKVSGGGLPAQIWRDVMVNAHKDLQPIPLPGTSWQASRIAKAKTTSKDRPVWQATNAPSPPAAQPRKNRRTKPAKRIDPPQKRPRQHIVIKAPSKITPSGQSETAQTRSKPPVARSASKRVAKTAPPQQPPKTPPLPDVKPNVWSLALGRMLEQGTLPLASKERGPRSFEAISDTIRVGQSSTSEKSKRRRGATRATTARKPKSRLPVANRMALGRRLTQTERAALQNP